MTNKLDAYTQELREIQKQYEQQGITLIGIMPSKQNTDYDIFYELAKDFAMRNPGHQFFSIFRLLKKDLEQTLNKKVDIIDTAALAPIGKDSILNDLVMI